MAKLAPPRAAVATIIRSEVTMKFDGDLPRDYITNTVYHSAVDSWLLGTDVNWQNHANEVRDCFTGDAAEDGGFTALAGNGVEVKVYDMADATPRPVKATSVNARWAVNASPAGVGPPQLALCLSYFCGRNLKHMRGHIYIGPFQQNLLKRRPDDTILNEVLDLGKALWNVGGADITHVLYRPTSHDTANITDYWVDDSWDTQRRRSLKATHRVVTHP